MGVTAHFLTVEFRMTNYLVGNHLFAVKHTGENNATELITLLHEFELTNVFSLTTDNAANMVLDAALLLEQAVIKLPELCFSHTLQVSTKNNVIISHMESEFILINFKFCYSNSIPDLLNFQF